jgi:hypothetical protein
MPKQRKISAITEECARLLQRLVRMKAADEFGYAECITCGKVEDWHDLDGGHFVPRKHKKHKLREENVHPQCRYCNRYRYGALGEYTLYMIDMYGRDFVEWLWETKSDIHKPTRQELLDLLAELKQKIAEQEKRLGP